MPDPPAEPVPPVQNHEAALEHQEPQVQQVDAQPVAPVAGHEPLENNHEDIIVPAIGNQEVLLSTATPLNVIRLLVR